jgi:outer membrane protein TolC
MNKAILMILILLLFCPAYLAQNIPDEYIKQSLINNLALQQKYFSLEKTMEALNEAKGMFFPSVAVQARYTRAGGGRIINFPVGDLLNPVYKSLNSLFRFHGIASDLPTDIPNERIPFLREREQETKLRVIQPVFQPALYYNYKLRSSLVDMNQAEFSIFKRQLIAQVKNAYFNYLKTIQIIDLLNETCLLLEENLRVSKSLFDIGKATEDVVFRAQAEISSLEQQQADAKKNKILAKQYFNFLLNRDLDSPIDTVPMDFSTLAPLPDLNAAINRALEKRNEFQLINHGLKAVSYQADLAGTTHLPAVTAVLDYGIQGETYRLGKDDDYWMASLVLEWNLFNGNQSKAKKAQALLEKKQLESQRAELENQIKLQVNEAHNLLQTSLAAITAAKKEKEAAEISFKIIEKKYKYGTASQIEFIDARTAFTKSVNNYILACYEHLINQVKFEQVTAKIDISELEQKFSSDIGGIE